MTDQKQARVLENVIYKLWVQVTDQLGETHPAAELLMRVGQRLATELDAAGALAGATDLDNHQLVSLERAIYEHLVVLGHRDLATRLNRNLYDRLNA